MLKISRKDIPSDHIVEYDLATRYIKLDINVYLELLGVRDSVNAPQVALINAVNNPKYRFVVAALARRLGKTYIANIIAQLIVLVPGCNVIIVSPNYNLSSISFELQRSFLKKFSIEVTKDNTKDKIIELSNGSTARMGSLSTIDSCVGRSYNLILFDEAALGNGRDAFNVALRPTLDRPNSKAIFISTPRGRNNWFAEFFDRGFSDDFPEWCSIQADWRENPRMTVKDIEEAKRSMSPQEFEQEYCASFNVFEGQVYQLDPEDVIDYTPRDKDEAFAGLDPGFRDPTAFATIIYQPVTDCYHIVDEYQESGMVTSDHASRIQQQIVKWNIDQIYIDSAAAQFAQDLAYEHDIATARAQKSILPGIAFVQMLLAQNRLKVSPNCVRTLAMFDQYKWKPSDTKSGVLSKEETVHDEFSHMADAIRYALYTHKV